MKANRHYYQSYLLRIWKDNHEGEWRATLQNIATGECHHFASLDILFGYVNDQTGQISMEQRGASEIPAITMIDR